jgi:hypothetical protein
MTPIKFATDEVNKAAFIKDDDDADDDAGVGK